MADQNPAPAAPAPVKKSKLKKILKVAAGLFLVLIVGLILFPTIASKTFLKGTIKSQLAGVQGMQGAEVGKAELGWTSGVLVDGISMPSQPYAHQKDRPAFKLEHLAAKLSLVGTVLAVLTHGEVNTTIEAQKASIYLELLPDGKNNLLPVSAAAAPGESKPAEGPGEKKVNEAKPGVKQQGEKKPGESHAESKTAESKPSATQPASSPIAPSESKPLPISAKSVLDVKEFDVEIADCTSSTGAIQRTVIKGLRMGSSAALAKDMTASVDPLEDDKKAGLPTFGFDTLRVTLEQPKQPDKLVIGIDKLAVVLKATYAGPRAATADLAPTPAFAPIHQLDAKPLFTCARVYSDDFDLEALKIDATVESPGPGKKVARLLIEGSLKGQAKGTAHIVLTADLCAKPRLPITVEAELRDVELTGALAKSAPNFLPVLSGSGSEGSVRLSPLTFTTKGGLAAMFDDKGSVDKDPTLKSIDGGGNAKAGPCDFTGSKILQGFGEAFEKINLKDVMAKALGGGSPTSFDSVNEVFGVKDGVVTIPKLELARQNLGIVLDGTCSFAGDFKLGFHINEPSLKRLEPDVQKLLACVDKAGGIGIVGKLGGDYTVTTPPMDALAKALLEGGAVDIWKARDPKNAAKLDAALSKYNVDTKKIQEQPKEAAKDAGKTAAEKELESKQGQKLEKKLGVSDDQAKKALGGLFGGDKKDDQKKADDTKKDDDKKDDATPKLPFKNPFGGGN